MFCVVLEAIMRSRGALLTLGVSLSSCWRSSDPGATDDSFDGVSPSQIDHFIDSATELMRAALDSVTITITIRI